MDGYEYEAKYFCDLVGDRISNGELIELGKGEFFSTKKHFVRMVLGLSKIFPFQDRINFYLLALRIQFTDIYDIWLRSKINSKKK